MRTPGRLWVVELSEELNRRLAKEVTNWKGADKRLIGDQLMRAAYSIGANLVEGNARPSPRDSIRFYSIALASLEEVRYWIHAARDRNAISRNDAANLSGMFLRLARGINNLILRTK
jgi:four helix bundle protein